MNSKLSVLALVAASALLGLPGCAADTSADEGAEPAASQDELRASAAKLVGSFQDDGASVSYPSITNIVFHDNGVFSADVDTGIRCIKAPCPSGDHFSGRYSATKTTLTLDPMTSTAPQTEYHGKYKYTLKADELTLTRKDFGATWQNTLARDSAIWPADATKLVAHSPGGGFVPPAPPGSTCGVGKETLTLDVASKELSWELCDYAGGKPLHLATGSRTVTDAELATIVTAAKGLKIAKGDICGADKPLEQIDVTTPAGTKTYTDSFYSCWGSKYTFVDDIGSVFSAMRDAVK